MLPEHSCLTSSHLEVPSPKYELHCELGTSFFMQQGRCTGSSPATQAGARYNNAGQQQRSTPCCGPKTEACMCYLLKQCPGRLLGVLCSCLAPRTARQNPSDCLHSTSHSNARREPTVRCAMLKNTSLAYAGALRPCTSPHMMWVVVQGW